MYIDPLLELDKISEATYTAQDALDCGLDEEFRAAVVRLHTHAAALLHLVSVEASE